ncbi:Methyl-accepting chemotaxis protein I (serine chemoreceptor protein) [plant metagenome]|uniref:Methyl-accepting chemotaxis protein I (Serine chemoreceptor protein) n=1 Tax=plant metagenome TaxID=1297885 RepID=A0A484TKK0_9ZZZZ
MLLQSIHKLSLRKRLGLLVVCAVVGVLAIAAGFLLSERALLMDERAQSVRQTVESAHSLVARFHARAQAGQMTDAQARTEAMDALRAMRYSGSEYFWVNDMAPRMVMHPVRPELDGKDLAGMADPNGLHLFVEFVNVVKAQGGGLVYYMWPKPGHDEPVRKASYVIGFAPWGWVIGSGVYVDTVEATFLQRGATFGGVALLLAALLLLIGMVISRGLLRQIGGEPGPAAEATQRMARGDLSCDIPLASHSEGSLLHAIRAMRDSFAGIVTEVRGGTNAIVQSSHQMPRAAPTWRRAPNTRPARWKKPRPPWRSSPPPCARTPTTPRKPPAWWPARPAPPRVAARSWSASSPPWATCRPRRARSWKSSRSSTASPRRPTSWP